MLSKACPACGSPLFEYKGETLCVVCAERGVESAEEVAEQPAAPAPGTAPASAGGAPSSLVEELDRTLVCLCERIRGEVRADDCLVLMECVAQGIEARRHL